MAALSLIFDILARDNASGALRNVGDQARRTGQQMNEADGHAGRLGTSMGKLGSIVKVAGLAFAGVGIADFLAESVKSLQRIERINAQTSAAIKSTGSAAGVTAQHVEDLTGSLENLTATEAESTQQGANMLLTFTNIKNGVGANNQIFDQAVSIMTDMTRALDTTGGANLDASKTALQLGKALNDPIKGMTALQRVGVSFTQTQKDQVAQFVETGDIMGAQKIILAELTKEFGGAGEAFAKTTAGKVELAKHALGTFGETITGFVLPAVAGLASGAATAFNAMADGFSSGEAKSKGFKGVMEGIGVAAKSLFDGLGQVAGFVKSNLTTAFGVLGPALGLVFEALGGIASIIGSVAGWFADLPGPIKAGALALGAWLLLRGPLDAMLTTLTAKYLAFGSTVITQGGLVAAATTGLKGAAGGLLRAFGGPLGLAITGVTVGLGFLVQWMSKTDDATGRAASAQSDFAAALRESKGAIDANVRAAAAKDAQDAGLLDNAETLGISLKTVTDAVLGNKHAYEVVAAAAKGYDDAAYSASNQGSASALRQQKAAQDLMAGLDVLAPTVRQNAHDQQQLAAATSQTDSAMSGAVPGVGTYGQALALAGDDASESADAIVAWIQQLQQIGEAFVQPLSVYQDLLQQKKQSEQDAAQATADTTESSKDSWQDYVTNVTVSLDEYATKLQEQITNQENWRTNLGIVAARAGDDVAKILSGMGQDGVDLVAQMANGTDAEMKRMADLLRQDATLGGYEAGVALETQMKVMAAIGAAGGKATAQQIAQQLGLGIDVVMQIAAQYASTLGNGINPLLAALGHAPVRVGTGVGRAIGQAVMNATGNLYENHQAEIAPGGAWRVWAEPETGGEAYIPLAPSKRSRSLNIWQETGKRLGVQGFANGGFMMESDVPRPPSTAPFGPPISTAGDAAMDTAFSATANFVREQGPFGRALAWARSQVGRPYIWGGVGPAGYDCSGFMSAITNVLRGKSPYSRVGATASFPWPGFVGGDGIFTIGSTNDAGGGIGHMAGTLMGVNVESRGGQGVVVGASARGAHNGLFNKRAHLAMAGGGVIGEPVSGIGLYSGRSYSFGERGPETVTPGLPGGGTVTLQLDGPATVDLLEGRAVSVVTSYASAVYNRGAYN